jgi:hypothetical protein
VESLIEKLADYGPLGIITALCIAGLILKDRALTREKDARIADSKALTDIAMRLQEQSIASVDKMAAIFEEVKKYMPGRRQ